MTKEQRKEYLKGWRERNKAKQKMYRDKPEAKALEANRHLLRTYGISLRDKQAMWDTQNGVCSVCNKPLPSVLDRDCQVEHCHKTGRVRSLAHWYCNIIVGVVENHPLLLTDVTLYLSKHNSDAIVRTYGNDNRMSSAEMSEPAQNSGSNKLEEIPGEPQGADPVCRLLRASRPAQELG